LLIDANLSEKELVTKGQNVSTIQAIHDVVDLFIKSLDILPWEVCMLELFELFSKLIQLFKMLTTEDNLHSCGEENLASSRYSNLLDDLGL
jgi:hypothetical protein